MKTILRKLGLTNKTLFGSRAFSRNLGLVSAGEQLQLAETCVAVAGLGGVGGVHATTLARLGIGKFHIADFDIFEAQNFNRQYGAKVSTLEKNKLEVMTKELRDINPFAEIEGFPEGVTEENIESFLSGVDVLVDGLDIFSIDVRRKLFRRARERGIPVVTAGPMGFSTVLLIFAPEQGMSFDDYFQITDEMSPLEKSLSFQLGISPSLRFLRYLDMSRYSLENRTGPSVGSACQLCAGVVATEVLRIVLKRGGLKPAPHYYQFDPYLRSLKKGYLWGGNRHPWQRFKLAYFAKKLARTSPRPLSIPDLPPVEDAPRRLHFLLDAAVQAPSGDNCQPWRFEPFEDGVAISIDPLADTSPFNEGQFASIIACGAAIENMCLAAKALGLKANLRTNSERSPETRLAEVQLVEGAVPQSSPLLDAIWARTTNRRMYQRRELVPVVRQRISELVQADSLVKISVMENPAHLRALTSVIRSVDRIRVENKGMHEFLYRSIRFTETEARESRDGMPVETLDVGKSGKLFLQATRSWKVMSALNSLGFSRVVAALAARGMSHCSAAVLLTVPDFQRNHLLEGGRMFQRLWLELTALGLQVQPMAALPIFRNQWMNSDRASFGPKHTKLLEEAWPKYQQLFPLVQMDQEAQIVLLRIGYDNPLGLPRTYRKSVSEVLNENRYKSGIERAESPSEETEAEACS